MASHVDRPNNFKFDHGSLLTSQNMANQTDLSSVNNIFDQSKYWNIYFYSKSHLRNKTLPCTLQNSLHYKIEQNSKKHCSSNIQSILRCILSHDFADDKTRNKDGIPFFSITTNYFRELLFLSVSNSRCWLIEYYFYCCRFSVLTDVHVFVLFYSKTTSVT